MEGEINHKKTKKQRSKICHGRFLAVELESLETAARCRDAAAKKFAIASPAGA
jgi:hypothetical protein